MGYTSMGIVLALGFSFIVSRASALRNQARIVKSLFSFSTIVTALLFLGFSFLESVVFKYFFTLDSFFVFLIIGAIGVLCIIDISLGFYFYHIHTQDFDESVPDSLILLKAAAIETVIYLLKKYGTPFNKLLSRVVSFV